MGAAFCCLTYNFSHKEEVKTAFDFDVQRSLTQSGSEYSGEIGMLQKISAWKDLRLATQEEAEKFIENNHEKWDGAMAVSFHIPNKYKSKEDAKAQKLYLAYQNLVREINKRFLERKSLFIGCKHCKSRISMKFVSSTTCPLCSGSFLSDTDKKRIEKAEAKYRIANDAAKVASKSEDIGWAVGGWASS